MLFISRCQKKTKSWITALQYMITRIEIPCDIPKKPSGILGGQIRTTDYMGIPVMFHFKDMCCG